MKFKNTLWLFSANLLLIFSGCMKQIHVVSNTVVNKKAISSGFAIEDSFSITPRDMEDNLFTTEITEKIEASLNSFGYTVNQSTPDYFIYFKHEVESSQELVNTPKRIPGEIKSTQGYGHAHGNGYTPFGPHHASECIHYQEITTTSDSIVYVPEMVTVFTHTITLEVYQTNQFLLDKKQKCVWEGSATCCDNCGDQRYIIDYLLKSLFKYFGKSTKKNIHKQYTNWF